MNNPESAPIVLGYNYLINEPPVYIATCYPLTEVDWINIKKADVSATFLGAGLSACFGMVIPVYQYSAGKEIDRSLIYEGIFGLVTIVLSISLFKLFDRSRKKSIKKIDQHFVKYGIQ